MPNFHPLYDEHLADWREYRLSYEGGRPYLRDYLFRHPKEPTDYFRERMRRAVHPNHMRAVVDTYAAHLYREAIPRSSTDALLPPFWDDIDLLGNSADEFYEQVAQLVQVGGRAFVVVDRYDPDGATPQTRAQEIETGRRPYVYAVGAEDLVDWDVDRLGRWNWAVVREPRDVQRDWQDPHPGETWQYRLWTRTGWQLYIEEEVKKGDGKTEIIQTVVDEGEHPCGEVPIIPVFWGKRHAVEPVADSALKDLVPMNRRLTNLVSLIDEQIYGIVFSIMAVPRSTYDALGSVDYSVYGAIPYEDEVATPPHYLTPDVAPIEAIQAQIDKTEQTIRQLSGLGRVNDETQSVQTGIALSYLTMDKDALLAKFGARMQRCEQKVNWLAGRWMETEVESETTYPDTFDPMNVDLELDAALKFASLGFGGRAAIENAVVAAKARLGSHLEADELADVIEDIRATTVTPTPTMPPGFGR